MSRPNIKHGVVVGTGAAINVQLGWIPHSVEVYNASDGDLITTAFLVPLVMPFSGGGTAEIVAGSTIRGVTSLATAQVSSVLATASTWSAGTAAGFLTLFEDSYVGTFTSTGENIVITNLASGTIGTDDATIVTITEAPPAGTAFLKGSSFATAAAVAYSAGTDTAITRYAGVAGSASKGFTIGLTVSESGKLLRYRAMRGDAI